MIRLSRLADYGVILMTQLAHDETLRTAPELAADTALPAPTVAKLLKSLAQQGLLVSHRGTKGGYSLARAPEAISVAEIIGAVEGPIALTDCTGTEGPVCDIESLCPTRTNWQRINEAIADALGRITLAEMTGPQNMFLPEISAPQRALPSVAE